MKMKIICRVGALSILAIVIFDIITLKWWITEWVTNPNPKWIYTSTPVLPLIIVSGSLIILGNLCVIAKIAHKTSEERISIRFVNRLLTFYSTVFSECFIEVLIGFVGQVILSMVYWKDPEKFIYFIIYTLVFFGFCAAPISRELINNLEGVYIKAFYGKLERRLTRMEKQYIIIGYGRFGKTVINDLFENYVYNEPKIKSIYSERRYNSWRNPLKRNSKFKLEEADKEKKPVLLLERMLNEGCEEILFCINMVIIDEERLLSKAFPHPYFGKMGVVILDGLNCLRYDKKNYKKQVYIPAIVGDARDSLTLDFARVNNSKMVLSLIPEEDATPRLFDIIYKKQGKGKGEGERKGIITGTTTAQERLLISQSYNTNISFLHRDACLEVWNT